MHIIDNGDNLIMVHDDIVINLRLSKSDVIDMIKNMSQIVEDRKIGVSKELDWYTNAKYHKLEISYRYAELVTISHKVDPIKGSLQITVFHLNINDFISIGKNLKN